jgi:DNA-binding NtrC family response regulator
MDLLKNTNKRFNILLLEDSSMDADIIKSYLTENFKYDFYLDIVSFKSAFLSAISSKRYDLILADFSLPDIDGFTALKQAKSICPLTPFIIVSGTIGEETAVELLIKGATDYILKDRLGRLSTSIERALIEVNETERLKQSEQRLEMFFHQSITGIFIMTQDEPIEWNDSVDKEKALDYIFEHQKLTKINKAMLKQYGYTNELMVG